jgi:hypothetical protein
MMSATIFPDQRFWNDLQVYVVPLDKSMTQFQPISPSVQMNYGLQSCVRLLPVPKLKWISSAGNIRVPPITWVEGPTKDNQNCVLNLVHINATSLVDGLSMPIEE